MELSECLADAIHRLPALFYGNEADNVAAVEGRRSTSLLPGSTQKASELRLSIGKQPAPALPKAIEKLVPQLWSLYNLTDTFFWVLGSGLVLHVLIHWLGYSDVSPGTPCYVLDVLYHMVEPLSNIYWLASNPRIEEFPLLSRAQILVNMMSILCLGKILARDLGRIGLSNYDSAQGLFSMYVTIWSGTGVATATIHDVSLGCLINAMLWISAVTLTHIVGHPTWPAFAMEAVSYLTILLLFAGPGYSIKAKGDTAKLFRD